MRLYCLLPVFLYSVLFAQNWAPVNLNDIYNFKADPTGFISHSVWVDSVKVEGNDSVFYMNRIVRWCDTCQNFPHDSCYILVNQPQFYQRKIRKKPSGFYVFQDPDTVELHPLARIANPWMYNRRLGISALVIKIDTLTVFGVIDSVKYISLTTGDFLLLTKHHGFISFFDPSTSENLTLAGVEGGRTLGDQVPQTLDFFDFEVGDEFQYLVYECTAFGIPFGSCRVTLRKKRVVSKTLSGNTIQYSFLVFDRTYTQVIGGVHIPNISDTPDFGGRYSSTLSITQRPGVDPEGYPGQMTASRAYGPGLFSSYSFQRASFLGGLPLIAKDYHIPLFTSDKNTMWICDGSSYGDDIWSTVYAPDVRQVYHVGLGLTYESVGHLDGGHGSELIGYLKNGSTTGIVFSDQDYATSNDELESAMSVKIFPNPSDGKYYLAFESASRAALQLKVYDITGALVHRDRHFPDDREIEIDLGGHPPGMYLMQLEQDGTYHSQRIMIR